MDRGAAFHERGYVHEVMRPIRHNALFHGVGGHYMLLELRLHRRISLIHGLGPSVADDALALRTHGSCRGQANDCMGRLMGPGAAMRGYLEQRQA